LIHISNFIIKSPNTRELELCVSTSHKLHFSHWQTKYRADIDFIGMPSILYWSHSYSCKCYKVWPKWCYATSWDNFFSVICKKKTISM